MVTLACRVAPAAGGRPPAPRWRWGLAVLGALLICSCAGRLGGGAEPGLLGPPSLRVAFDSAEAAAR
ncbi:MAG: hypothetical protein ABIL09_00970, partial [Gemmatimonadota bacterium]